MEWLRPDDGLHVDFHVVWRKARFFKTGIIDRGELLVFCGKAFDVFVALYAVLFGDGHVSYGVVSISG